MAADPHPSGESVLVLYADSEEPSGRFSVYSEERHEAGWVTLVRLVDCPDGCLGGEVWAGSSDLARCHVCGGRGHVAIGVGGAYIFQSIPCPIPDEPDLCEWENVLRHYLPATVPSGGSVEVESEIDSVPRAEHEAAGDRIDILRAEVGLRTRERDEWEANEQEQAAEVTRLREALDNLRVPIEEALRHLNPNEGCGYRTYKRTWDNLRAAFDAALADHSEHLPTRGAFVTVPPRYPQAFVDFFRDAFPDPSWYE